MYRTLIAILGAFALALLAAGLTFSKTTGAPADFRFVNGTEPKTLDPHLATGQPEGRVIWSLFEGLTRYEAKTMRPSPGVAESWEISPDGLRYTFALRKDARWSVDLARLLGSPVVQRDGVELYAVLARRLVQTA
ncbi:MAG TPA: ABC transporter substrate-binding protein [Polyangiaceae bacterium]|jgi:oligopeptide transport system substrate-binding protein